MAIRTAFLSVLALLATAQGASAAAAPGPVVMACNLPARSLPSLPAITGNERVFKVSPGSLQTWDPARKAFGQNLCAAYSCVKAPDRSEGTISSASVSYTIGVTGGQGYWRSLGATGGGARSGSCRIVSEPPK